MNIYPFKNSALFQGMTEEEILSFLHCTGASTAKKMNGEYILRAGETTRHMGLLLSGSGLIIQEDIWGHRNIMAKVSPGDVFAESFAASPKAILNVSVVASDDCTLLKLNRSSRHIILSTYPNPHP